MSSNFSRSNHRFTPISSTSYHYQRGAKSREQSVLRGVASGLHTQNLQTDSPVEMQYPPAAAFRADPRTDSVRTRGLGGDVRPHHSQSGVYVEGRTVAAKDAGVQVPARNPDWAVDGGQPKKSMHGMHLRPRVRGKRGHLQNAEKQSREECVASRESSCNAKALKTNSKEQY